MLLTGVAVLLMLLLLLLLWGLFLVMVMVMLIGVVRTSGVDEVFGLREWVKVVQFHGGGGREIRSGRLRARAGP